MEHFEALVLRKLQHVSPHRVTELHAREGVQLAGHVHGVLHQVLVLQEEIPEHVSMSKDLSCLSTFLWGEQLQFSSHL